MWWGCKRPAIGIKDTPANVQQVANELGMNYVLARSHPDLYLVLLNKFAIVDSENLSAELGHHSSFW